MTSRGAFRFLNLERRLAEERWDDACAPLLWRYNLHYFDDLNAERAGERVAWHREAIERWIAANPPAAGPGWDSYPTSLRIVNWVKWALAGNALDPLAATSLAFQVRWLAGRLEWHIGGNHLFSNAKALIAAGAFFAGDEARAWMRKGLHILRQEMHEQILADGGHYERSPMYHTLALEDVLDLMNLLRAFHEAVPPESADFVASWPEVARRMRRWLDALSHPDGEFALFNDAASGIAAPRPDLDRYFAELVGPPGLPPPRPVESLRASGYVRIESADCVLLADVAPVGPDDLPGHAHADTLSFELSLFGERVIVNGGTSTYELDEHRLRERGTRSHSTVGIDGADSSEVWASFRVARRARPFDVRVTEEAGCIVLCAAHDGYRRLPGRPVHRRRWTVGAGHLVVEDFIAGSFHEAIARFHLKPGVVCEMADDARCGTLRLPAGRSISWKAAAADVCLEDSLHAPEFGKRLASRCLALALAPQCGARLELTWQVRSA